MDERFESGLSTVREEELENFRTFMLEVLRKEFEGRNPRELEMLNVACGYMREAPVLTGLFKKPIDAIDQVPYRIGAVREQWSGENIRAIAGDANCLTEFYRKRSFDLILMRHPFIEFSPEITKMDHEDQFPLYGACKKVLHPSGRMVSTFHIRDEMESAARSIETFGYEIRGQGQNPDAIWEYGIEGFNGIDGYYMILSHAKD